MITLDPIGYKVQFNSVTLELQPLTFELFAKLFDHAGQILSIDQLTRDVWAGVVVSPDTLKQRVFLLRKALQQAGLDAQMVQSVRSKGYRLVLPPDGPTKNLSQNRGKAIFVLGIVAVSLVAAIFFWWPPFPQELPENDRVAFWTSSPLADRSGAQTEREQQWRSALTSLDGVSFVALPYSAVADIRTQARQARVALISFWEFFKLEGEPAIRVQIIEPKTAMVLRSEVVKISDDEAFDAALNSNQVAISDIVRSGILPLSRDALVNTDHPAWETLRTLANIP